MSSERPSPSVQSSPSPGLPDLSGLTQLAGGTGVDIRPVLLRVQTDLFVGAPVRDRAAVEAYEALATGLLPRVDDETAAVVARKLGPCEDAPLAVLKHLLDRGGEARRAVIAGAAVRPIDPSDAIERGGADLKALAEREDLDEDLILELLALDDPDLDRPIAGRGGLRLPDPALALLSARARGRADLAALLLRRADLSLADEAALYLQADEVRRVLIRARLAASPLTSRAGAPPRAAAYAPALLLAAARGDVPAFEAELAEALGVPGDAGFRLSEPDRAELLALALVAAGIDPEDAVTIFLTLVPEIARSVDQVFHLAGLARTTPRPVASRLVSAILGAAPASRASRYVPAHDPARRRSAAVSVGAPAQRRGGRDSAAG